MTDRLTLYLLGKPRVERDGEPVASPRGKKVWGLAAYLLRADTAPTRERLAALLFGEADDPLGALRWNLTELRRMIGDSQAVRGEPLELALPPGTFVDVRAVTTGTWVDAVRVPGLGLDLLEGMNFNSSPAFDAWLLTERRHLSAAAENVLREAVLAKLSTNEPEGAVSLARHLVQLDPLHEPSQALLVQSLSRSGDLAGARQQLESCRRLFLRELGVEPGPEVMNAAAIKSTGRQTSRGGPAEASAQFEAGQAAISAGSVEAGIDCLRRSVAAARSADDTRLQARALLALGSALIHSVRALDDEGSAALHEAVAVASHDDAIRASAYRELGYVELLRGRYERAERWIKKALEQVIDDPPERAMSLSVLGACLADTGRHEEALDLLTEAVEEARQAEAFIQESFALSFMARTHLMRRELDKADVAARRSLELARSESWTSFVPWPQSLVAEVALLRGEVADARDTFEHAFALGCQLGDPCWEGMGQRGLGLIDAHHDMGSALGTLRDARTRSVRLPDAYLWVEAYALDALCSVGVGAGDDNVRHWIDDLESLAGRTGMREFVARSYLYRARLGDHAALGAAELIAANVQNPALAHELEEERQAITIGVAK